jgi:L-xylulokinase
VSGSTAGPLLLGIDCGQTVGKAALFDLAGREVAVVGVPTQVRHPQPRWAERDLDEVWRQTAAAIRQVLARSGGRAVAGVGLCGHGDGLYLVDADLQPVRAAVLATDSRAHEYARAAGLGERGERALALTGQVPFAGSPAAIYGWLRDHEPAALAAAGWGLFCKDWVRARLTGRAATDPTEASASFTDLYGRSWCRPAFELYDLADVLPLMPPILASDAVAGQVTAAAAAQTGLPAGIPVVCGAHDVDAAALGIGAVGDGVASVVLGTFSINQVVADRPVLDRRWQARAFLRPDRWLHMSTSPAGAANLDWAVRRLGPLRPDHTPDPAAAVLEGLSAVQVAAGDDSALPLFLPFLFGSPHGDRVGAGWLDVRGWHDRPALLAAVLEGVAFNHRTHLDLLREQFELTRPVRVCGGGARSPGWTQLLADVLDLPVEVTDSAEAGARGAALLAGLGAGVYPDLDTAVQRAVRVLRRQDPRPGQVRWHRTRYRRYLAAVDALTTRTDAGTRPSH